MRKIINVADDDIVSYDFLKQNHVFALNVTMMTLSLLTTTEKHMPVMVCSQQYSQSEFIMLLHMFESFPYYCSYELLLTVFETGKADENDIQRNKERLDTAIAEGTWDTEMRPVRNVLSRLRIRSQKFGIAIVSIVETGYALVLPYADNMYGR